MTIADFLPGTTYHLLRQGTVTGAFPLIQEEGQAAMTISYDDFAKVDVRVGRVMRAELNEGARKPAYALAVDFGAEIGELQSSVQITEHYTPESLVGRLVLGVVNFPPKRIGGFESQCLILGVPDAEGAVVLLAPDRNVPIGGKMF